jgi:HlyD family secretion protein
MAETATSPGRRRGRKPVRIVAIVLAGMAVIGTVTVRSASRRQPEQSASTPAAPAAAPTPAVTVETVTARVFDHLIRVTGTLKSDEVVALSTKAAGMVRQVLVKEGDRVRQGQLLVQIDDRELRAQRAKAAAAADSAAARLKQARTSRGVKNAAVEADYRRAVQGLTAAQTRLSQARSLARISATEVEANVASARANLQAARQQLQVRQEGARRQEKASAGLEVTRAQAQVAKLRGQLDRREQLLREGAIAREDVENVRQDYEVAVAALNSAKQQADLVNEGSRLEEIRIAEEGVRQAQAALASAEANRARRRISDQDVEAAETQVRQAEAEVGRTWAALAQRQWNRDEIDSAAAALAQSRADVRYYDAQIAQTRVYSPVNGVVSQRKAHVGETVSATKNELMTLVATDGLYFEATAPEGELPYLRAGQPVSVTLDALPGERFAGTVREIIPVAEGASRSVRLRIAVARPEHAEAVVGGFARATVRGQSSRPVLTVPLAAVVSDEGSKGVFVVADGRARWQVVQTGAADGKRAEVQQGLRAGDQVVVKGAEALADGQAVRIGDQEPERKEEGAGVRA